MKQYIFDSGQLGGLFNVIFNAIFNALGILGIITFINTSITAYQSFWGYYLPLLNLTLMIIVPLTVWFLHAFFQLSLSQYSNRHGYELHE